MPQDIPPRPTQRTARKRWLRQWGELAATQATATQAPADLEYKPAKKKAKKKASKKKGS